MECVVSDENNMYRVIGDQRIERVEKMWASTNNIFQLNNRYLCCGFW